MVKVFYCDISSIDLNINIDEFCVLRKAYVESITDANRKRQSILVWKLLLYALNKLNVCTKCGFFVKNRKWSLNNSDISFSLSHSNNIVCVAIDNSPVSIDVEIHSEKLKRVVLKKFSNYSSLNTQDISLLASAWCEYECKIKNNQNDLIFSSLELEDKLKNKYTIGLYSREKISLELVYVEKIL